MLQENHVPFDIAPFEIAEVAQKVNSARASLQRQATEEHLLESGVEGMQIVPTTDAPLAPVRHDEAEIRSDLHWLGESAAHHPPDKVRFDELKSGVAPLSSALFFNGALPVHALLDVLRQYFLKEPIQPEVRPPSKLPKLVAPSPFSNAAAQWADVIKTKTHKSNTDGSGPVAVAHTAEVSGFFFPGQVRKFLELLRVVLPGCSCSFGAESPHTAGINTFTQLGLRRVTAVECEQVCIDGQTTWNWEFKLGA